MVVDVQVWRQAATTQNCNLSNLDTDIFVYHRALHICIRTSLSSLTAVHRAARRITVTKPRRLCSKDFF